MARLAPHRILLNLLLDSALAGLALPLALLLASPGEWPPAAWWLGGIPGAALALALAGLPVRLSQQYWRFAGLRDLLGIAGAALLGALIFWGGLLALDAWRPGNPAFPVLHALVLGLLLGLPRIAGRLQQTRHAAEAEASAQPVLLVGTGDAADLFIRALAGERRPSYRVTGILSMRSRQAGRRIQGHPILGTAEDAAAILDRLRAEGRLPALIVLATPHAQGPALESLLDAADRHGIPVRRAPSVTTLDPTATRHTAAPLDTPRLQLRPVAIEDLLDRPQVPLDRDGMARLVQGRRVLVTGAGGTIGGELARQVAALGPAQLTLLDHGEYVLYEIDLELRERHPELPRRAVLADIRDEGRIRRLFEEIRPELVFHAAALKHVPMVENDPLEGLLTNALGTRVVADAARAVGCRAMVFISTDKAVNPTSVMGASKRLAEMYCQALDMAARSGEPAPGGTAHPAMRCVTVRFGNVLGSTGSVVPLFRRQLERGGPLTVTHPDMRRYFMTVREAVGLVLQASVIGAEDRADQPPELREGGIFVLDMGKPVKIVDLARRMIRLAGLRPEEDVEIRFTGLRPGEKLYEELFHGQEPPRPTHFPGLLVATPRTADPALVGRAIDEIAAAARSGTPRAALAQLGRLVPEFDHNADGAGSRAAQ
ncbi:polysaccharide biosynthesis protein [Siccirubricoccus sp. KC 17139]|uniref:Polysaccharide biosynthesis protein n=1 Tax=Siccirubricoccus soli TaxID=2899147 RepID=A0ABT1DCK9_9PROT|nr:nucleoside-diphosphate sugar epimerase/dehydratase [Siccirubricoccus soli]MCO6419675.1 polysaccharide biosynthesis protein [Siccirubricoccus soli]MCP2685810.1 polysaccharide biosynthesis protein [Siccirubricoccus soli]